MALHSGVSGGGAVVKRPLARRRTRGTLVRCRAYVWSKDDLARLDALARRPRDPFPQEHDMVIDSSKDVAAVRTCRGNLKFGAGAVDAEETEAQNLLQSPVQAPISTVTTVAATLIDLSL